MPVLTTKPAPVKQYPPLDDAQAKALIHIARNNAGGQFNELLDRVEAGSIRISLLPFKGAGEESLRASIAEKAELLAATHDADDREALVSYLEIQEGLLSELLDYRAKPVIVVQSLTPID